jgi:hypothetical protein
MNIVWGKAKLKKKNNEIHNNGLSLEIIEKGHAT